MEEYPHAVNDLNNLPIIGRVEEYDDGDTLYIHFNLRPKHSLTMTERSGSSSGIQVVDGNVEEYTIRFPAFNIDEHHKYDSEDELEQLLDEVRQEMNIDMKYWDPYIHEKDELHSLHLHGYYNGEIPISQFARKVKQGVNFVYGELGV